MRNTPNKYILKIEHRILTLPGKEYEMYLSLSWRNIWRNKKRTLIVVASVFFAVLFASIMRSAQTGSYSYMIHSSAKLFTGYLQIQGEKYWDNQSLDNSIIINKKQQEEIQSIPYVTTITPRLTSFMLISFKSSTRVAMVTGINPVLEDNMTGLKQKVVKGDYLTENSDGVLIGKGLAEVLKISIGDSVVLYGQGYHGQIAAAILPVSGFVKLPFDAMNNRLVFLALRNAQSVYSAEHRITSLPIMIKDVNHLEKVLKPLQKKFGEKYAIKTWKQMMPELVQSIQIDNASGIIMLVILYIVIGFGVFGTIMMMVAERTKEFGILISVGMKKWRLIWVTTLETLFISFLGVITGIIGSLPLIFYLHNNPIHITGAGAKAFDQLAIEPIFNFSIDPGIFISQALVVFLIAFATIFYPILFIQRLEPINALHA